MRDWARANDFALRLVAFYIAIFLLIGCNMPFMPVWLNWRGLTDWQIAITYAAPVIMRPVFTPAVSFAADRAGRPVLYLKVLAWGSLLSCLTLPFVSGFGAIFTANFMFALFWMSIMPLTEAVTMTAVINGQADYGRVRLWGSIAFVAMTLVGGVAVELWGAPAAVWLFIGSAAIVLAVAYWLPDVRTNGSAAGRENAPHAVPAVNFADLVQLVRSRELWLFLAATSFGQASHAVYYVFGTLHWKAIGISPVVIGMLWAIGVVAEIMLFAYAGRIGRYVGPVQFMLIGGVAALLRWTFIAGDPPLALLFCLQTLHGFTYGASHIGAMQFIRTAVPERLAMTVQGLYASITMGLGIGLAQLAAGPLYRSLDGDAYFVMAGLGVASIVASLMLMRRWRGDLLVF